jgi:peptidoglycan/xylan/chitin deacetylase (PgdA/CDA1 family)
VTESKNLFLNRLLNLKGNKELNYLDTSVFNPYTHKAGRLLLTPEMGPTAGISYNRPGEKGLNKKGKKAHQVRVPILYYHRVAEGIPPRQGVSPSIFESQMNYLRKRNYRPIGFADLAVFFQSGDPLPPKPVIISFDDGYLDTFTQAYPILMKAGFTATVFIVSGFIGDWSSWEGSGKNRAPLMTKDNILTMSAQGFHFGGHTQTHKKLVAISPEEARREIETGKRDLEELLQKPVHSFAYPYGDFNDQIISLVEGCGFKAARTVHTGNTHKESDLFRLCCIKLNGLTPPWKFRYYLTGLYHLDIQWQEWKKAKRGHGN